MSDATTKFASGAVRSADRQGQRYDLISPIGMRRIAETCHEGAVKYSDFNWEKGMPVHDLLNHAIAHIYAYLAGERKEDDLAHAAWNLLAAMHSEELWPQLNVGTLRLPGCVPPKPMVKVDIQISEGGVSGPVPGLTAEWIGTKPIAPPSELVSQMGVVGAA